MSTDNCSLFQKARSANMDKKAMDIQKKMEEIENCLQQNRKAIKNIFEKNMYTEDEIIKVAKNGHSNLPLFQSWAPDQYNPSSTGGFVICKSVLLDPFAETTNEFAGKFSKCYDKFYEKSCKQVKKMFQELNQKNDWDLRIVGDCNYTYNYPNLNITWVK